MNGNTEVVIFQTVFMVNKRPSLREDKSVKGSCRQRIRKGKERKNGKTECLKEDRTRGKGKPRKRKKGSPKEGGEK